MSSFSLSHILAAFVFSFHADKVELPICAGLSAAAAAVPTAAAALCTPMGGAAEDARALAPAYALTPVLAVAPECSDAFGWGGCGFDDCRRTNRCIQKRRSARCVRRLQAMAGTQGKAMDVPEEAGTRCPREAEL
jgi:phage tail tape-measure protein